MLCGFLRYSVSTTAGTGATINLLVNNAVVPNSAISIVTAFGTVTSSVIATLAAGSTVSLEVLGTGAPITITSNAGASLTIIELA